MWDDDLSQEAVSFLPTSSCFPFISLAATVANKISSSAVHTNFMAECLLHPPSRELSYFSPAELNP